MVFSYIPFKSKYNGGLVLEKSGDLPKGDSPFLVFSSFLHLVGILVAIFLHLRAHLNEEKDFSLEKPFSCLVLLKSGKTKLVLAIF